jgi:GT2 family glycosyltransferase
VILTTLKAVLPPRRHVSLPAEARPQGISVIIPSRNGKDLLATLLPEAVRQIDRLGGEVIVIDNGSDDGTADFLSQTYPMVRLDYHPNPLSFARATNAGIRISRFSHVCFLNNDMGIAEGFFEALLTAFSKVPDLFCATAQIFFPPGAGERTGKAVLPLVSERSGLISAALRPPLPGEDLSYVIYGSGGCSLFDAAKLSALGGLDEGYQPAYVEDLDLGFRAWQLSWPSVFVAGAQTVHKHRATASRYYTRESLERLLELHYLRFLAHTIVDPRVFCRLWTEAISRLSFLSMIPASADKAQAALAEAWRAPFWAIRPRWLPQ